jgi:Cd2+/Zn2+-exporting ATPase
MHVLMVAAAVGALLIGEHVEAGAVLFLFAVARELEQRALGRARVEVRSLMDLTAPDATVLRHGHDVRVPIEAIRPGELVLVKPGERIPVDGTVVNGSSEVDVSAITGEPVPEGRFKGDQVLAGSLNGRGALEIVCDRPAAESALGRILASLEAARAEKSRAEAFVDRFARIYTPLVMVAAALVAALPPLFFGGAWGDWGYRALVLLVVACPCALVISTPVTVVSALTGAVRRGILVKNGVHLEVLGAVRTVAIDKTGTLTEGTPRVTDVVSWDGTDPGRILELAATAESRSEHPVGRAILEAAREGGLRLPVGVEMEALPGRGARARTGGREILLGSPRLFREQGLLDETAQARTLRAEARGATVVLVAWDDPAVAPGGPPGPLAIRGAVLLADRLRDGVSDLLRGLRENGVGRIVCMSGDRSTSVDTALAGLGPTEGGFDEWRGDLLPEEKVEWVRQLRREGPVLMIGDGVNDAPALAAADTGMAMGLGGTGLALDAADIALMHDDLRRIPEAFRIGRKASRIIRTNIAFAIAVKLGFVALGGVGLASLWMAVLADMGSSLAVIGNGLRALRSGPPEA